MNRNQLNEIIEKFERNENRLKMLSVGQIIYEMELSDPMGGSYFAHRVVGIDLEEMKVITQDLSQGEKSSHLLHFYLGKEIGLPDFEDKKKQIKMEKKNITITVSGEPNTGKSRLSFYLKKFLKENGFDVNHDGGQDFENEETFDRVMSSNVNEVIDRVKETKKITIKESHEYER